MSVYSYESFLKSSAEKSSAKPTSKFTKVGYFSLKEDGATAIVRFAYKNKSEFDIVTVHTAEVNGNWKRVSCLRENLKEPVEKCPFCEAGEKLYSKFYVKLIEYTKDEQGNVVATPKIWERPAGFAQQLDSLCTEYGGDLCDHVFKIKRRGAKGDMQTTYDVMYANPELYKESVGYVKDLSAFAPANNFDLAKHSYYVKSFDEMVEFLETGKFPDVKAVEVAEEDTKTEIVAEATLSVKEEVPEETKPATTNPYMSGFGFSNSTVKEEVSTQTDPTFSRPRRTPQSDIYK